MWRRSGCLLLCALASGAATALTNHWDAGPALEDWKCDELRNGSRPQNRSECIINSTITKPSLSISFDGDILFSKGAAITATQGGLLVNATGNILFLDDAKAKAARNVSIIATDIFMTHSSALQAEHDDLAVVGDNINVSQNATLTANTGCLHLSVPSAGSVTLQDHTHARSIHGEVAISGGHVTLGSKACIEAQVVSVNPRQHQGLWSPDEDTATAPSGNLVQIAGTIQASNITVRVYGDAILSGCLQGPKHDFYGAVDMPAPVDSVWIIALQGSLTLNTQSTWNMGFLALFADTILVSASTIKTGGSSCNNRNSARLDQCAQYTQLIPVVKTNSSPAWEDANVSFDLLLVAQSSLTLQNSAYLTGGSMLVCSGKTLLLKDTTLDAKGRGCGPGQGDHAGCSGGKNCRAGAGGSHEGAGGAGAEYNSTEVAKCANATGADLDLDLDLGEDDKWALGRWPQLTSKDDPLLPTAGASGGGCSVATPCQCVSDTTPCAAAGGLVWLSGVSVSLNNSVQVLADGSSGITNKTANASETDVSGGGAGGHILLWVSDSQDFNPSAKLVVDPKASVLFSAQGGDIECTRKQVGGAGGGGYIAINYHSPDTKFEEIAAGLKWSVEGGGIADKCRPELPRTGINVTLGGLGSISPIYPCQAGEAGPLCTRCDKGFYSTGTSACQLCDNKPKNNYSVWTTKGWHNSSCPYKCVPSVPDVRTNPQCLPAPSFVFKFFGGLGGALLILFCIIAVSGYLLWRRRRNKKRHRLQGHGQTWRPKQFPCSERLGRISSACRARFRCCKRSRDAGGTGALVFTKEQLPYHVCRVYLCGQNDSPCPWGLSGHLPAVAEPLVLEEQWGRFAAELNTLAEIRGRERFYKAAVGLCCPPLVASLACWFRKRRARLLQQYTQRSSECTNTNGALWKPIRARCQATGELAMVFGCDQGATLAYLDFFDFSRSQLDWAPVDLRQDARVLLAHGKGTYSDPLCLDMGDPLVAHLAQSDFGAVAVCAVISTFNRISRTFRAEEVGCGVPRDQVAWLRQKVEQCASQCGLADMVHVFTCQHCRGKIRDASVAGCAVDVSFMDLMPPPEGREDEWRDRGGQDSASPHAGAGRHSVTATVETKLCLAFASPLALQPRTSPSRHGAATGEALTSPLAYAQLAEHLSEGDPSLGQGQGRGVVQASLQSQAQASSMGAGSSQEPLCNHTSSGSGESSLQRWWQALQVDHGSTTPATVLVIVIVLLFTDLLACILVGVMLVQISRGAFVVWMLIPPLTQALALMLGPIFMLSERPGLGRLYARLTLWSVVSAAFSSVALLAVQSMEYWLFNFAEFLTLCLLKAGLYLFTCMHVRNLEAAWDLSFMDAPQAGQADFLGQILSTESSRRFGASAGHPSYLLPQPHSHEREDTEQDGIQLPTERSLQQSEFQSYAERLQLQPWTLRVGAAQGQSQGQGHGQGLEGRPESFLQPYMRSSEESSGSRGPTIGGVDSLRHSSGRSWEGLSLASSPTEPSPF